MGFDGLAVAGKVNGWWEANISMTAATHYRDDFHYCVYSGDILYVIRLLS